MIITARFVDVPIYVAKSLRYCIRVLPDVGGFAVAPRASRRARSDTCIRFRKVEPTIGSTVLEKLSGNWKGPRSKHFVGPLPTALAGGYSPPPSRMTAELENAA